MVFVDSIYDLQYYNNPPGAPCYCEQLVYASDLQLQHVLPTVATSGFTFIIEVLSADGLTTYEDATIYFTTFIGSYQGTVYFGIKLNSYSPAMCQHKCWILRVRIAQGGQTIFDKYTQRYCQTSCCDVPRGISFTGQSQPLTIMPGGVIPPGAVPTTTECGDPLIRIEVVFDCVDNFGGEFYGDPNVLQGTGFTFQKITNIAGRIKQRPREIVRQESYNCKLQRSESFVPYLLESKGYEGVFPTWKMNELEQMFHANHIYVSDFVNNNEYSFAGGSVAIQVYRCWELWKLQTTLRSCTQRQTFGCATDCDPAPQTQSFLIGLNYGGGQFYTEEGLILNDYDALLDYYRTRNGVTDVEDTTGDYATTSYSFNVTGNGYPRSFYFDRRIGRNKVFGTANPVAPVIPCQQPIISGLVVTDDACQTPVLELLSVEDDNSNIYPISSYGDWEATGTVSVSGGVGSLTIQSRNYDLPISSPLTQFSNEIIGFIPATQPRPLIPVNITHEQDENIPEGGYLSIDQYGYIRYSGYATDYDMSGTTVMLDNVYYNLNNNG